MKLIVGLGNPGKKYEGTRHNMGFMAIDLLSDQAQIDVDKEVFHGLMGRGKIFDEDVILFKPTTFMNLSGDSIRLVQNFYKIDPEDILVICDDFNLPFLKLRLRKKGSAGGHNGLKSIIENINSEEFPRLRIGIGLPDENYDIIDYVLSKFTKEHLDAFKKAYKTTNDIIDDFINDMSFDLIMNRYNTNESL